MSQTNPKPTWNTKYGTRRVRHEPPTLEQAIFAAKGLTDDIKAQAEIAASLMGLPAEEVRAQIMKSERATIRVNRTMSFDQGTNRAVVVERKITRRPVTTIRKFNV